MAKKAKTKGVKYWKKKAWNAFSMYIRLRDAQATTSTNDGLICCTCGKYYPAFGIGCAQAGHFIPGRKNAILFDEEGVHGQCYNCNVNLKGNWPEYLIFMQAKYGQKTVDRLLRKKYVVLKFQPSDLEEKRDVYKQKYEALLEEKS